MANFSSPDYSIPLSPHNSHLSTMAIFISVPKVTLVQTVLLFASCYIEMGDKCRPDGSLGLYVDLASFKHHLSKKMLMMSSMVMNLSSIIDCKKEPIKCKNNYWYIKSY